MSFFPLELFNITVVNSPLLKDYFWVSLNINSINTRFSYFDMRVVTKNPSLEIETPIMRLPPMPVNSCPCKIVLHFCNNSDEDVTYSIRRIKCCDCECVETQVAINQYRMMYNCPHRLLVDMLPREGVMPAKGNSSLTVNLLYNVIGIHNLKFEMTVENICIIIFKFNSIVLDFDPAFCLITNHLFPVKNNDCASFYQPLWFYNPYNQNITFEFCTESTELKLYTSTLTINKYELQPLMVKYKPNYISSKIKLTMKFFGIKIDLVLRGNSVRGLQLSPIGFCPKNDISCAECPYILYENCVFFRIKYTQTSTRMVAVHNNSTSCIECKWKKNELDEFYEITVEPETFLCRPNHPVLCIVKVKGGNLRSCFHHISLICEIHRFKIPPVQVEYEELHSQQETIDDPSIFECTLITKLYLNVNLEIDGAPLLNSELITRDELNKISCYCQDKSRDTIEKKLWKYIFNDEFLNLQIIRKVSHYCYCPKDHITDCVAKEENTIVVYNRTILSLRRLMLGALEEIARQWRFIPKDLVL